MTELPPCPECDSERTGIAKKAYVKSWVPLVCGDCGHKWQEDLRDDG